ncbi:MAG: radical SAM protein, partial [Methanocellales archaeon]|nr:radical SAM protein [Methanocellales archaeon]
MKIALVSPPSTIEERYPKGHPLRKATQVVEPLGLAYIAAVLEQNHFEVEIFDCIAEELTVSNLIQKIKHSNPSVVGISAVTPNIHVALKLANEIKRVLPDITIVLGGVHPTLFPQQILKNGGVDIVVIGEGEYTMFELSETLDRGGELDDVLGIAYRKDGKITICPPRPLENDLDNLPFPARHLLPMHSYKPFIHKRYPAHALMSSRGCPFQCVYCCRDISGRHHRLRGVENVIEEIKVLAEEYNTKEVDFQEPVFCLNKKWTENFCHKLIEENLDIIWSAQTRVDLVDETILRLMKNSGCWMLYYGIEAGDQLLLDNMKKNVELSQIRKSVELTSKVGIKTWG